MLPLDKNFLQVVPIYIIHSSKLPVKLHQHIGSFVENIRNLRNT